MRIHQGQAAHRQRVESSSLSSVGYETDSRTLEVEFRKGGVYRYFEVPASVHESLMKAPSKGRFFVAQVRDRFPFARVFESDARSSLAGRAKAGWGSSAGPSIKPRRHRPQSRPAARDDLA